jgi:hypothetical protein
LTNVAFTRPIKDPFLGAALFIILALFAWRLTIADALTGDVAMYLQCGRLLLEGQTPYIDFIDLNPPLIFYLSIFPALLAKLLGFSLLVGGICACGVLSIFSLCLCNMVMLASPSTFPQSLRGPFLLAMAVLPSALAYDLGQREHLLMLLWLPFFLLRLSRVGGQKFPWPMALFIGALAGLGFALKHYFLLLPLALELTLLLGRRKLVPLWTAEVAGAAGAIAAYGLSLLLLPPAARHYLFDYLMPLLLSGYSALDKVFVPMVLTPDWRPTIAFMVAAFFLFAVARLKSMRLPCSSDGDVAAPLALFEWAVMGQILAGMAVVQLQHRGWCYHSIPMMTAGFLLVAASLSRLDSGLTARLQLIVPLTLTVIFSLVASLWLIPIHVRLHAEWEEALTRLAPPGSLVAYLDTTDTPWYVQTCRLNLLPGCRYLYLFPVSIYESLQTRGKIDRAAIDRQMRQIVEDIGSDLEKRRTPLVVLKTRHCYTLPDHFDLQQYLDQYGLSQHLSHYRQVEKSGNYLFFKRLPD